MGKLIIADHQWLNSLENIQFKREREVNYWSLKQSKLQEGDYFLLTNGRDAGKCDILAIAQFVRNETLTISEAWEKYDKYNGADSFEEFINRLEKVLNIEVKSAENEVITCTILNNYAPLIRKEQIEPTYNVVGQGQLRGSGIFITKRRETM